MGGFGETLGLLFEIDADSSKAQAKVEQAGKQMIDQAQAAVPAFEGVGAAGRKAVAAELALAPQVAGVVELSAAPPCPGAAGQARRDRPILAEAPSHWGLGRLSFSTTTHLITAWDCSKSLARLAKASKPAPS